MDPAQEPHPDRRVLAQLCWSAQTFPTTPQITGHFQVGMPTLNAGATPGLPQQVFCQHFQLNAQRAMESMETYSPWRADDGCSSHPGRFMRAASSWFPWSPSEDLQPCALGVNKDLLFLIRDLMILSMGRRLQT